jgi:RNA polymerase sigma factor (sigma-70 family)
MYTPRLVARARAALGYRLRQKVDPEDVVQSVYCSLLRAGYLVPDDQDELWRLLLHRTRRKVARKFRLFRRKRRDAALEVPLSGALVDGRSDIGASEPVDYREPSVDEAARIGEATSQLLAALTETERAVIERCLRHQSVAEIANSLQCSTRTVERARSRACDILRQEITSETA